jgi:hypothetical protein
MPALLAGVLAAAGVGILGLPPPLHDSGSTQAAHKQEQRTTIRKTSGQIHRLVYDFVDRLSRRGTYREPRPGQAARLANAFGAVKSGRLTHAAALARPLGYGVVRYRDIDSGRTLVLLIERRVPRRGWGLYVHSPGSRSRLIVEVAHPASDVKSERVGVETFRSARAADLFVAGALRDEEPNDSADVAHNGKSAFEAVHRAALAPGWTVLQPHGFDSARRGDQYGEIVVSSGGLPTELVRSLAGTLTAEGFDTCLYERGRCEGLGATTNVQGRTTRAAGALFIHVEMARRLRETQSLRARIVSALAKCLGGADPASGLGCDRP